MRHQLMTILTGDINRNIPLFRRLTLPMNRPNDQIWGHGQQNPQSIAESSFPMHRRPLPSQTKQLIYNKKIMQNL